MKLTVAQITSSFKGSIRLWCYDASCIGFLLIGLLGLVFGIISGLNGADDKMAYMLVMTVVSVCIAVSWQLMRLSATEWASLVPGYKKNVLTQAGFVLFISFLLSLAVALGLGNSLVTYQVVLAFAMGLSFVYVCTLSIRAFYFSVLLFLFALLIEDLAQALAAFSWPFAGVAIVGLCLLLRNHYCGNSWQNEARSVYLNVVATGGVWLPLLRSGHLLNRLERYLHPVNFFMGPMLSAMLVGFPMLVLFIAVISRVLTVDVPVLFLLVQFTLMICLVLHWSRVQGWRAAELLFMLPGFSGKQGMIDAFFRAQWRLIGVLMGAVMAVLLLLSVLGGDSSVAIFSHILFSVFWGCGLILAVGMRSRDVTQLSLTMLIFIVHSVWVVRALEMLTEQTDNLGWVVLVNLCMSGLAVVALYWGKRYLWKHDILKP